MTITRCRQETEAEIEAQIEWRIGLIVSSLEAVDLEAVADRLMAIRNALPETVPIDHRITHRLTDIASRLTASKPARPA